MITEILRKWFGLDPRHCEACEILREQLYQSEAERKELLHRLLDKDKPEPSLDEKEEIVPIRPQFTPWRVRQQMFEQEDRKRAELLDKKNKEIQLSKRSEEIKDLEEELGVVEKVIK